MLLCPVLLKTFCARERLGRASRWRAAIGMRASKVGLLVDKLPDRAIRPFRVVEKRVLGRNYWAINFDTAMRRTVTYHQVLSKFLITGKAIITSNNCATQGEPRK